MAGRKKQVLNVQVTVRRVTFNDLEEAAAALERWRESQVILLKLLDRFESREFVAAKQCRELTLPTQDLQTTPRVTVLSSLGLTLTPDDLGFQDISIS